MEEGDVDTLGPDDAITPLDTSSVTEVVKKSHDSIPPNAYQIKPSLQEKYE